ncbi:hypothetical protein L873DRAFT_1861613 [Choiromyces venosus 120613-1]|uniref:Uncharacterized protein n=1 Tax=Choiromyces venosus 120613-1 TaxID=1336337 RepID=A0A3N4J5W7_9PEZI|nr:hypothetical protein L873DRAFT_1861613 [Choiromyces venosus 120613-1]
MQDLYDELWGKPLRVIEPRTFSIPQPQHGLRPGYMVDLKEIKVEAYPDPEFAKGKKEQVFQVLKVKSRLPCGTNQFLVHQEFETIERELWEVVDSHSSKTDANSLFDLPNNQKKALWILMDEKLEDAGWNDKGHGWFVVQADSPKKVQNSWQWEKDRKVRSRYMSNWGWCEIVAAFSLAKLKPPTACQMAMLFTTFTCLGPISRICLESISMRNDNAYNRDLKTYLGHVDREIDTFILQGSYLMVQVEGGQGIEQDGIGKYFLPFNTNFELVDGLVFSALDTLILLQITITNSHPIKLRGVKNLYESLLTTIKNIHIVFIILEDCISKYSSTQSGPEAGDVKPGVTDLTINQFRLVLAEETIHLMAIVGHFKVRDGGRDADESGSRDYDGGDTAMGGTQ